VKNFWEKNILKERNTGICISIFAGKHLDFTDKGKKENGWF